VTDSVANAASIYSAPPNLGPVTLFGGLLGVVDPTWARFRERRQSR
jgi:hypothetical protein